MIKRESTPALTNSRPGRTHMAHTKVTSEHWQAMKTEQTDHEIHKRVHIEHKLTGSSDGRAARAGGAVVRDAEAGTSTGGGATGAGAGAGAARGAVVVVSDAGAGTGAGAGGVAKVVTPGPLRGVAGPASD